MARDLIRLFLSKPLSKPCGSSSNMDFKNDNSVVCICRFPEEFYIQFRAYRSFHIHDNFRSTDRNNSQVDSHSELSWIRDKNKGCDFIISRLFQVCRGNDWNGLRLRPPINCIHGGLAEAWEAGTFRTSFPQYFSSDRSHQYACPVLRVLLLVICV